MYTVVWYRERYLLEGNGKPITSQRCWWSHSFLLPHQCVMVFSWSRILSTGCCWRWLSALLILGTLWCL